ncbi:hypothetical protein HanRHA438_Chr14g0637321 [Helianthus annuus]|nr:hypothetical protein HanRHA438_Chr14g0637321 [Helianthus annuus]
MSLWPESLGPSPPSLYSSLSLPHRINFIYNCFDPFICYIHSGFDCESLLGFFPGQ